MRPLTNRERLLMQKYRNEVVQTVRAFLHSVPAEGGDELDRVAQYSNGTVLRIVEAVVRLPFNPKPKPRKKVRR